MLPCRSEGRQTEGGSVRDDVEQDERLVLGARWGRLIKGMRELGEQAGSPPWTLRRSFTERLASAWLLTSTAETMRSEKSVRAHGQAIADGAYLVLSRLWEAADGSGDLYVPVGDCGNVLEGHWGAVREGVEGMHAFLAVVRTIGVLERERRQRPGDEPSDRGRWAVDEALRDHIEDWLALPAYTAGMRNAVGGLRGLVGDAWRECLDVALAALDEREQDDDQ